MFHISKKIYLEYDFKFNHNHPFIVASERWSTHPIVVSNAETKFQAPSFDELLETEYDNNLENFWAGIISGDSKLVVFLDEATITKLQIQYWRSIFEEDLTPAQVHFLHTSYVESIRLATYHKFFAKVRSGTWAKANVLSEVNFKTLEEITELYNNISPSTTLQAMDKSTVGIEYLLADYFADETTPYGSTLMGRIKTLTWDNWLDELEHLKYEILSGTIDAEKLDPSISTTVGNVEAGLANSSFLSWTVDPLFNEDIDYIRATYDHTIFVPCWQRLADQWGMGYDDMEELNNMINADDYEGLLMRDINRNYGSSYTRTRFMEKANQTLATWVYDRVRTENKQDLVPYKLKR